MENDPFWDAYSEEDRTVDRGKKAGIRQLFTLYHSVRRIAAMAINWDGLKAGS